MRPGGRTLGDLMQRSVLTRQVREPAKYRYLDHYYTSGASEVLASVATFDRYLSHEGLGPGAKPPPIKSLMCPLSGTV